MKVACRRIRLKRKGWHQDLPQQRGELRMGKEKDKMEEKERGSLGKDSNTNLLRNSSHTHSVLRPHLWHWDYLPKGKSFSGAAALLYLDQNQSAVPCCSSKTQQHGSDEEKGPKVRGTGRHNKEKA